MIDNLKKTLFGRSALEQHVAVFGESGSGKTCLLTSLYGWQQEPEVRNRDGYHLSSCDTTVGQRLISSFVMMRDDHMVPPQTRFRCDSRRFDIRLRGSRKPIGRLHWHDYPGEWWQETREGEEQEEKIATFRKLLASDLAIFLVDGARLKTEGGPYVRRLFRSFRDEIERQAQFLLEDGETKLVDFPRTWLIALSKADLHPGLTARRFGDLVLRHACDELEELRSVVGDLLIGDRHIFIGEDYLLLSCARFDEENRRIVDPTKRIGVEFILPLTVVLPMERAVRSHGLSHRLRWSMRELCQGLRTATSRWLRYLPIVGGVFRIADDCNLGLEEHLLRVELEARERRDEMTAILAALQRKVVGQGHLDLLWRGGSA